LIIRGINAAAHRGYQSWHRSLDKETVKFLLNNPDIVPEDFYTYLNNVYGGADMVSRFGFVAF
jgi:hypothetical protein